MKIRHYLLIAAVALLLAGSFFLPNAVADMTDSNRLDRLIMIDAQSISSDSTTDLAMPERLVLVSKRNTMILPLKTGNAMDIDAAKERISLELDRFFRNGAIQFDSSKYTVAEGAALLVIDDTVPTPNMIVWELVLKDESENTLTVTLDDETGLILRLIYKLGSRGETLPGTKSTDSLDDEFYSTARSLVEMMNNYYGFVVTLGAYEFSGSIAYYRADLYSGGRKIPMYGAVRATSFTINERVSSS